MGFEVAEPRPAPSPQWQFDHASPPPPEELVGVETSAPVPAAPGRPPVRFLAEPASGPRAVPAPLSRARPESRVVRGPVERPRRTLDPDVKFSLELFAGKGHLTLALKKEGLETVSFEITDGAQFDLIRRSTQQVVLSWIRAGKVEYVHV